jgi:hypothetical protein
VFNKTVDEEDEPAQVDFKGEVGHYVNGRLWRSFTDAASCNQAVGEALKALEIRRRPRRTIAKRRRQGDHHTIFNPERASHQGHFG